MLNNWIKYSLALIFLTSCGGNSTGNSSSDQGPRQDQDICSQKTSLCRDIKQISPQQAIKLLEDTYYNAPKPEVGMQTNNTVTETQFIFHQQQFLECEAQYSQVRTIVNIDKKFLYIIEQNKVKKVLTEHERCKQHFSSQDFTKKLSVKEDRYDPYSTSDVALNDLNKFKEKAKLYRFERLKYNNKDALLAEANFTINNVKVYTTIVLQLNANHFWSSLFTSSRPEKENEFTSFYQSILDDVRIEENISDVFDFNNYEDRTEK